MKNAFASLPLLLAALAVAAQEDPLQSAACAAAFASLRAARETPAALSTVEALRGAAASGCLGSADQPARPARIAQPPVGVPPPQIVLPARVPWPAPTLPQPPLVVERAPLPATCDAGGCWSNEGTHLRHVPPTLAGPRGLCTPQGGQVLCP